MFICDVSVFNRYGKQKLDQMLLPLGLDWHMFIALLVAEQIPGVSQLRLTPFLQTDKANVTKILQELEVKGLLLRKTDPADKRHKVCHLTDKGKKVAQKLAPINEAWEAACFSGIEKGELAMFRKVSGAVMQNLMQK